MIVAEIAIHPFGSAVHARVLYTLNVWNTGAGTETLGEYHYEIFDAAGESTHTGSVHRFPRTKLCAVDLVARVLAQTHGTAFPE
jgi:hypothetical protein